MDDDSHDTQASGIEPPEPLIGHAMQRAAEAFVRAWPALIVTAVLLLVLSEALGGQGARWVMRLFFLIIGLSAALALLLIAARIIAAVQRRR